MQKWLVRRQRCSISVSLETKGSTEKTKVLRQRLARALILVTGGLAGGCAFERYAPAPLDPAAVPQALAAATIEIERGSDAQPGDSTDGYWSCPHIGLLAAQRSRAVAAARADVRAAGAVAVAAGRAPPLEVQLGVEHHSVDNQGNGKDFGIGPAFSYVWRPLGRRRIARQLAATEVLNARAAVLAAAWEARREGCAALNALAANDALRRSATTRSALLEAAAGLAREQTRAGLADGFAWQSVSIEANAARLELLELLSDGAAARARLAGALGLMLDALPAQQTRLILPAADLPAEADWRAHALQHHPRILMALADYQRSERALEKAVADQYPDIDLSPGYFFDQGDHVWSLAGGIVLPLLTGQAKVIAGAAQQRDAARLHFEAVQADIIATVQQYYTRLDAQRRLLQGTRETVGQIDAQVASLVAQAQDGLLDGLTVKRAELQRAVARLSLVKAEAAFAAAYADLEQAAAWAVSGESFERYLEALYADPGFPVEGDE